MTRYPRDDELQWAILPAHSIAPCFSLEVNGENGLKIKGWAKMHQANVNKN